MMLFQNIDFNHLAEEWWKKLMPKKDKSLWDRIQKYYNASVPFECPQKSVFVNKLTSKDFLKEVIISTPDKLQAITSYADVKWFFNKGENKKETATTFGKDIEKIFDYNGIRKKHGAWLAQQLGIKTCPYCNAQYAISTKKSPYHTFDHFFPKSRYPYLSVSFFNLIPACSSCNQIKSSGDTSLECNWHPYKDHGFYEKFQFEVSLSSKIAFIQSGYRDYSLLDICIKVNEADKNKNIEKHIKDFCIKERYNAHTDVAGEIIWKSLAYPESYRNELKRLLKENNAELTDSDFKRMIIGNYTAPEDLLKRPLAKLTSDLVKDCGMDF